MLSYGLWSRHIHRPQQSPPSSGNSHSFSQKLQARKMLHSKHFLIHYFKPIFIYILITHDGQDPANDARREQTLSVWQLQIFTLCIQTLSPFLHRDQHAVRLLMFRAHLPSNTEGEDMKTEAHWKRLSCGNRNKMAYFIDTIKISFAQILLNQQSS